MKMKQWHRSRSVVDAFGFAFRGIRDIFYREQNVRIQAGIGTLVVCILFFLRTPLVEISIALLAIFLIITLEMINTSLELTLDIVHPEYSDAVRSAKDIAAGAVLLASVGACIIGILIIL